MELPDGSLLAYCDPTINATYWHQKINSLTNLTDLTYRGNIDYYQMCEPIPTLGLHPYTQYHSIPGEKL
jgi:hypothetical protein